MGANEAVLLPPVCPWAASRRSYCRVVARGGALREMKGSEGRKGDKRLENVCACVLDGGGLVSHDVDVCCWCRGKWDEPHHGETRNGISQSCRQLTRAGATPRQKNANGNDVERGRRGGEKTHENRTLRRQVSSCDGPLHAASYQQIQRDG